MLTLLFKLTCYETTEEIAKRTVLYQLVFPTSFYLLAPYTESLFLLLAIGCLFAARRKHWWLATGLGFLGALTRVQGVMLVLPLAWELWRQSKSLRSLVSIRSLSLALVPSGLAVYALYWAIRVGDPLIWINSQEQSQWNRPFTWPWETAYLIAANLFESVNNVIDLFFLVAFIPLIILAFRRLPATYGVYMVSALLLPLFAPNAGAPLYAMPRYVLVLFPGFIILGQLGQNRIRHRVVLYLGFVFLAFLAVLFINWFWVA
jgi:hypothetical protein